MNDDDEIAEAYAVQEVSPPKWTSDQPTEPGWYWVLFTRRRDEAPSAEIAEVKRGGAAGPGLWAWFTGGGYASVSSASLRWWPVAIQPPEAL